nr:putative receptor-like protein kinase At4g00960 [Ipomoea batatas]
MDFQKCVVFLYLSSIILLSTAQPELRYSLCGASEQNYTQNSIYHTNLNTVLSSLSSNLNQYGFSYVSMGDNPDRVSATALCRGDVEADICRICVENATVKTVQSCPNQKEAFGGYDECMIHYSNVSTLGSWTRLPEIFLWDVENSSNPDQFIQELQKLLEGLRDCAANGFPLRKFAAGNTSGPALQTIYAAVQCSPDLSAQHCTDCLVSAFADVPCLFKKGGRVVRPSCNFRFETAERFFNDTWISEALEETSSTDEISVVESLKYDLITLQNATNNFSEGNKLGEGGFGPVYKGELRNGLEVAVKRLSENSRQGNLEFKNEVALMARLQHRNLAWTHWKGGSASNVIDPMLRGTSSTSSPVHEITKCIHIALLCVQENVADRPTMAEVLQMLSSLSMSLPVPSAPGFFIHGGAASSESTTQNSKNEMSISVQYPR